MFGLTTTAKLKQLQYRYDALKDDNTRLTDKYHKLTAQNNLLRDKLKIACLNNTTSISIADIKPGNRFIVCEGGELNFRTILDYNGKLKLMNFELTDDPTGPDDATQILLLQNARCHGTTQEDLLDYMVANDYMLLTGPEDTFEIMLKYLCI